MAEFVYKPTGVDGPGVKVRTSDEVAGSLPAEYQAGKQQAAPKKAPAKPNDDADNK